MTEYDEHTQGAPPPRVMSEADRLLSEVAPIVDKMLGFSGSLNVADSAKRWLRRARTYLDKEGII